MTVVHINLSKYKIQMWTAKKMYILQKKDFV